ncbi:restriction endonuclease [Streptomyces sp. NRRL S-15]|uniref:restriction endonuclease n=1 Tax=Streptomyces sp. NRRL S-15 TaxID=1463886 RepID=UPI000A83D504|nr:restriction endonuclease [Streptomyces sp. NRRL S-15]
MTAHRERITISVLESDNNKKGDLFGRAMQDLFHALGYEDFTLNVHRAGREIDIRGKHRTENRVLIAECKATKGAVGGADTNKFAGAAQMEQVRQPKTSPYFVSLGGFTSPAREQEEEAGHRMTLLDGPKIADELIRGRVIVDRAIAASVAGKCANLPENAKLGDKRAILIHEFGWMWAFFFKVSGKYSFFTLVHADGYGLHDDLSSVVIDADSQSARLFDGLDYLTPADVNHSTIPGKEEAKNAYFAYLEREFGGITLEGLPADREIGSKAIRLESLYVPLHLNRVPSQEQLTEENEAGGVDILTHHGAEAPRIAVSEVLQSSKHVAILAAPGGGKTTLLKRLAVAYAISDRRGEVADELPAEDWFPLFIRCRQLGPSVRSPITEIIASLPRQAERADLTEKFTIAAADALKLGKVLLLVDGLDEISDSSDRVAFAAQLRTFIGTYPATRVIVTSREAGFRVVSGAMSAVCSLYRIADLSVSDIFTLCRAWHHEVGQGSTELANKLAQSITSKPRVRDLAINPLLLTTLLLVQRWLGELPQKRSVLYDKAIEVLLMTWNREGHEPIDREEAMPQLAYAAFTMMKKKRQAISAKGLKDLFDEARTAMPEVLGYARMSSADLIDRVEERSSLLVQSGHIIEGGQLRSLYEFKHLTFQEYLAALACVESWNPERVEVDDYSDVLSPYLDDESWNEVVPLAAVLGGSRGAKRVVTRLIEAVEQEKNSSPVSKRRARLASWASPAYVNLAQCLIDEVQIAPELVRSAIDCLIRRGGPQEEELVIEICESKFGSEILGVAWEGFSSDDESMLRYASALATYSLWNVSRGPSFVSSLKSLIASDILMESSLGAAAVMSLGFMTRLPANGSPTRPQAYNIDTADMPSPDDFAEFKSLLMAGIRRHAESQEFAVMAAWAIAWMGVFGKWHDDEIEEAINFFIPIWREGRNADAQRVAAWAIWSLPLASAGANMNFEGHQDLRRFAGSKLRKRQKGHYRDSSRAAFIISHYAGWKFSYTEDERSIHDADVVAKDWIEKLGVIHGAEVAARGADGETAASDRH